MKAVWAHDNVTIYDIITTQWSGQELWILGIATHNRTEINRELLSWQATVTPNGWLVAVIRSTGRVGEFQGATFNLPLEVAAAIRRLA